MAQSPNQVSAEARVFLNEPRLIQRIGSIMLLMATLFLVSSVVI